MAELSINLRKELVLNAIRRIEDSKAAAIDAALDPRSSSDERALARRRHEAIEREFAWQWRNVKAILEAQNG